MAQGIGILNLVSGPLRLFAALRLERNAACSTCFAERPEAGHANKGGTKNGTGRQRHECRFDQTPPVGPAHSCKWKQATSKQDQHQKSLPKIHTWMGEAWLRKPFR